jgi:hypothetical protein
MPPLHHSIEPLRELMCVCNAAHPPRQRMHRSDGANSIAKLLIARFDRPTAYRSIELNTNI